MSYCDNDDLENVEIHADTLHINMSIRLPQTKSDLTINGADGLKGAEY